MNAKILKNSKIGNFIKFKRTDLNNFTKAELECKSIDLNRRSFIRTLPERVVPRIPDPHWGPMTGPLSPENDLKWAILD